MAYLNKVFLVYLLIQSCWLSSAQASKPNILFIAVDDLKPALSNYGDPIAHTPNFERLATRGVTFLNAHCQQAVCGPSRASVMTGLRPDRTRVWDLKTKIRDVNPKVITIPQHFKANGYNAVGVGKIFDFRTVEGEERDDPFSWSRPYVLYGQHPDETLGFANPEYVFNVRMARQALDQDLDDYTFVTTVLHGMPIVEGTEDVPDDVYADGRIAESAIALIEELAPAEQPFFVAVGFKKPHLPFVAPKKYWDIYRAETFSLPLLNHRPDDSPSYHHQAGWELRQGQYAGVPLLEEAEGIPDSTALQLIHGYYACVAYIDAQLGKVLDALEASGEAEQTIIVLWGDHGFHLGDHGMWCKHTNYEQATRVPFMIVDPTSRELACGGRSSSPVELVDIFASLCDVAGISPPRGIDGVSVRPILFDPSARVKAVATSQFTRNLEDREIMGYAWRNERFRYIEWIDSGFRSGRNSGAVLDVELYDYLMDPKESRNLALEPEYAADLAEMRILASAYKRMNGLSLGIDSLTQHSAE